MFVCVCEPFSCRSLFSFSLLPAEMVENQLSIIKLKEIECQSLESKVKTLTGTVEQHEKNLNNMKRERDRNVSNSQTKTTQMDAVQSELQSKMKAIVDLTWELNETRTKLTHTQQQLDNVLAEKIALQKSFDAITDDRNDVREKLRVRTCNDEILSSFSLLNAFHRRLLSLNKIN